MDFYQTEQLGLPRIIRGTSNRQLEAIDIEIIFRDAGSWWLYYAMLLFSGLKVVDVASLFHWNIDYERGAIRRLEGRSGRFSVLYLPSPVIAKIHRDRLPSEPLFPKLYTDIDDQSLYEEELHKNLSEPLNYLQSLLSISHRPIASLISFGLTHKYLFETGDRYAPDYIDLQISIANLLKNTSGPSVFN